VEQEVQEEGVMVQKQVVQHQEQLIQVAVVEEDQDKQLNVVLLAAKV
jgi:hypothetical protein